MKQAQDLRDQQKREKEEKEAALRAVKDKQKLTNFFGNNTLGGSPSKSGLSSVQFKKIAAN